MAATSSRVAAMRRLVIPALVLALGLSLAGRAGAQDFSDNGFITTWLLLGPYNNPGGATPGAARMLQDYLTDGDEVFEVNFYPEDGDTVDSNCLASGGIPCYINPDPLLLVPTVQGISLLDSTNPTTLGAAVMGLTGCATPNVAGEQDSINLNSFFGGASGGGPDNVMAYAFTYVKNNTGRDLNVIVETGSDDAIQIALGGRTVGINNVGRCPDATGTIHYRDQGTLPKDKVTRVMVKCFEGGGNWAFRLRFRDCSSGNVLQEPDLTIEQIPPADRPNVLVIRDLPDPLLPATEIEVKLTVQVLSGSPGAAVIKETIPFTYPYVAGSASNGGTFASGVITWNLPAPLANRVLTYKVRTPDVITTSVFTGTIAIGSDVLGIVGDAGPATGDPGWITQWLILDAICQQGGCGIAGSAGNNPGLPALMRDWITDGVSVTEEIVVPEDGLVMAPDFQGAAAGWSFVHGRPEGVWTAMTTPDADGCIDFNPMFTPNDDIMVYAAVYVINPTASNLTLNMGVGSDDSIKVLVNGKVVYAHTIPRGFCGGVPGGPQDIIDGVPEANSIDNGPVVLKPGPNLLMVGTWEGDGGWNMAARFQDASGSVVALPTSLEPEGYTAPERIIRVVRDIPDGLINGTSGQVTFTLTPVIGIGNVTLIEEVQAGKGLSVSSPSDGGVVAGTKITWNLGEINEVRKVTYTLTASANAIDQNLLGSARIETDPMPITGDTLYNGSSVNPSGFIKMWNHLGPLAWAFPAVAGDHGAPGACDANGGAELTVDWIANESESITEENIQPFPGMIVRPKYGGTGLLPGGGARAAGLAIAPGDTGTVVQNQFPVWKGTVASSDTIDHASAFVHGFDAEDHMTMSQVWITNNTGADINTEIGIGSDDAMDVWLNDMQVAQFVFCRGWGAANAEQNRAPVTLRPGENRLLVKVTDGCCGSGFRLRFRKPAGGGIIDCAAGVSGGGLLPPDISLKLESTVNPPPKVERDFASDSIEIGSSVDVALNARMPTSRNVRITETLPAGATVSAISDGGVLTGNQIQWDLANVTTKTVTYKLTPELCSSVVAFGNASIFAAGPEPIEGTIRGESSVRQGFTGESLGQWVSLDISSSGGGAKGLSDNSAIVRGKGLQIGRTEDQFHFLHVERTGDWEVTTRVDCQENVNRLASAGLMARATTEPFSAYIYLYVTPGVGVRATRRGITSGGRNSQPILLSGGATDFAPVWLRMKKVGTTIELSISSDGTVFTKLADALLGTASTQTTLPDRVLVGMAVTSSDANLAGQVGFSGVAGVPALPPFSSEPPPAAPQLNSAASGNGKVTLGWGAVAGVAGYNVYRTSPGARAKVNTALITGTSFEATGLTNGTEHCFVVRSSTAGGRESADSNQRCATPAAGTAFKRGDVDANGAVEITDPINLLGFLFLGEAQPPCFDSSDADDNGSLEITDAIVSLGFQFLGELPPPAPGPFTCGLDPTAELPGADFGCAYPPASCQ